MKALGSPIEQDFAAVWPRPRQPAGRWRAHLAGDRHSRRVAFLKHILPSIGVVLLVLVAVWPRLGPLLETVRLGFSAIDLREARELRMLSPRYAGIDRFNRPYVVTSAIGRQVPNRDDLMSLEMPKAEMTMHGGVSVVITAATAIYQSQTQLLDLFEDVTLVHQNGTRFVTNSAHVDVSANTAEGREPVRGHGPSGDITARGFRILEKGNTIVFTGQSELLLKGAKPSGHPATPPGLPAEVEAAAAQIEAAAAASSVVIPAPPPSGDVIADPAQVARAAKPLAAPKAQQSANTVAKSRSGRSPAARPGSM